MRARIALGALGGAAMVFGVVSLFSVPGRVPLVLLWAGVPLVLHDAVLVPATLALAWLGRRVLPRRAWGPAVVGLVCAATALLLALPPLLSPAAGAVPGLLNRDYRLGLALALAASLLVTALLLVGTRRRDHEKPE
ncbi:hypothetical protein ACIB24_15580 [Spongisporangium articulatum]|uniref:Uncharacterized protein n=1 Tax=Spongisporangium articulatum TaxID=3362603 RepID=A0ABW8AQ32_9ACTN